MGIVSLFRTLTGGGNPSKPAGATHEIQLARFRNLRMRMIALLILASLIPLAVISAGAWIVFSRIISEHAIAHLHTIVRDHAATVELFLEERRLVLDFAARSATLEQIDVPQELQPVFNNLNSSYTDSFLDLVDIDHHGTTLAYRGTYDLLGKN